MIARILYLVLVSLLTSSWQPVFADYAMSTNVPGDSFFSANHQAKAVFADNGSKIMVYRKGSLLYTLHTDSPFLNPPTEIVGSKVRSARDLGFLTGNLYISNDGHSLVWLLLPRFYGHVLSLGHEPTSKKHTVDQKLMNMPALAVFTDGKPLKSYPLSALLPEPEHVQQTASHTIWLEVQNSSIKPRFTTDGQQFLIQTVDSCMYAVNTKTGALQMKSCNQSSVARKN